jgi:hypothetical protein
VRSKAILRRHCGSSGKQHNNNGATLVICQISNICDEIFMKVLFSFHPTREIPSDTAYPILVGTCLGHQTYFIKNVKKDSLLSEDDAISVKKCISEIA